MAEWLALALLMLLIVWWSAPAQITVVIYKLALISLLSHLGYWIDRRTFWYARCGEGPTGESENWMQLRRAIIMAAVIMAGAMAL